MNNYVHGFCAPQRRTHPVAPLPLVSMLTPTTFERPLTVTRSASSTRTRPQMPRRPAQPPRVRHTVEIDIEEDYVSQLKRRMDDLGISQNALAKEMGLSPTQVSRWFVNNERRVTMLVETALHIERSILAILARREITTRGRKKHQPE